MARNTDRRIQASRDVLGQARSVLELNAPRTVQGPVLRSCDARLPQNQVSASRTGAGNCEGEARRIVYITRDGDPTTSNGRKAGGI